MHASTVFTTGFNNVSVLHCDENHKLASYCANSTQGTQWTTTNKICKYITGTASGVKRKPS